MSRLKDVLCAKKEEQIIATFLRALVPPTNKEQIEVRNLPYEDQIRLALEALHELIDNEDYTYNWDCYDTCEFVDVGRQCCLAGAFYHKYGCTSSLGQLSGLAYHAMKLEGKDAYMPPSLEAMLEVARQRMIVW